MHWWRVNLKTLKEKLIHLNQEAVDIFITLLKIGFLARVWSQVYPRCCIFMNVHTQNLTDLFNLMVTVLGFPWDLVSSVSPSIPGRKAWFLSLCICLQIGWEAESICGKWRIFRTITILVYWQGPECLQDGTWSVHCMKGEYLLLNPAVCEV